MKKIIDGKLYNTETAEECGFWSNGYGRSDFEFCEETLYRKKTGEYFLYGEGGPKTRYSRECSRNSWCGGEEIVPLTEDEARNWAECHLDADKYIEVFGDVEE